MNQRIVELEREIEQMHRVTRQQAEASAKLLNAKQERIMELEAVIQDVAIPALEDNLSTNPCDFRNQMKSFDLGNAALKQLQEAIGNA